MTDATLKKEAQQLLDLSEDNLFLLLVSRTGTADLYTKDSLVARGKQVFVDTFISCRSQICTAYQQQQAQTGNAIDLVVVIASALANDPTTTLLLGHVPVIPLAAIAVKMGLEQLCQEQVP